MIGVRKSAIVGIAHPGDHLLDRWHVQVAVPAFIRVWICHTLSSQQRG